MRLPWVSRARLERAEHELAGWLGVREKMIADIGAKEAERALWERLHDTEYRRASEALAARAEADKRYEALVAQVVDLKRAEAGLPPAAFDASLLDPMNSLGPKTQLAIDEFAAGDPEMKKYLVGRAHLEFAALRGQNDDMDAIDKELAAKIRRGDQ